MNAIPTMYKGIQFRSRTEAKWAAFFDEMKWPWLYEPLDLDGYIPDFILRFPHAELLVEVKSNMQLDELVPHIQKIVASGWDKEALVVGGHVNATGLYDTPIHDSVVIGALLESGAANDWQWTPGALFKCKACKEMSLLSSHGSFHCRVNGCYDGDHFVGTPIGVEAAWNRACNTTQWKSSRAARNRPKDAHGHPMSETDMRSIPACDLKDGARYAVRSLKSGLPNRVRNAPSRLQAFLVGRAVGYCVGEGYISYDDAVAMIDGARTAYKADVLDGVGDGAASAWCARELRIRAAK